MNELSACSVEGLNEMPAHTHARLRALLRTTNVIKNQKGETVLVYTPLRMLQGR